MDSNLIQIVDERDQPIGSASKQEAWAQGLWHRIVEIILEDGKGNVLLQHRSPTKDTYPNCLDDSVGGHVDAGESYEQAAYRELHEELGVDGIKLEEVGSFKYKNTWRDLRFCRFVKVYRAIIDFTPESHEPDKIDRVQWFSISEVKRLIKEGPGQVTDTLENIFARYY